MRRCAVATLIAGGTVLTIVALATGKGLTQKSVSFEVPGLDEAHRVAKCKAGKEAVAGGFSTEHRPTGSADLPLDSFQESKREWLLRARATTPDASTATVYVYCDKDKPRLDRATKVAFLDPAPTDVQKVARRCPPAAEVVGGGFASDFDGNALAVSSKRVGRRSWQVGFITEDAADVTVFASCDADRPGLKTKKRSTEVEEGTSGSVKAKCKQGQQLRSGGFEVSSAGFGEQEAIPHQSRRAGKRRWKVSGFAALGNSTVTAYAYCDEKKSG